MNEQIGPVKYSDLGEVHLSLTSKGGRFRNDSALFFMELERDDSIEVNGIGNN